MTETWVQIPAHRVLVVGLDTFVGQYVGVDEHGEVSLSETEVQRAPRFRRRRDGRLFMLARRFGQDVAFTAITATGVVLEEA